MSVPQALVPSTPFTINMSPYLGSITPIVSGVTLSTPTSATLITGASVSVTVPTLARFLKVILTGSSATVTAAATITTSIYAGATSGALTTLYGTSVVVAPTGGTSVSVNTIVYIPVTNAIAGSTFFISAAATASTGNYVLNAGSTTPTNMVVEVL